MKRRRVTQFGSRPSSWTALAALVLLSMLSLASQNKEGQTKRFHLLDATIEDIQNAYKSGQLTSRQLVQLYLNRIEAYDQNGPKINSIITVNPKALEEADRLDKALKASGPVGPLHGVPVILKDQIDAKGMPTTMGSVLFKNYHPDKDAFAIEKLKKAGAIILAKATLGELGGGDTHGSLFGSTRNPYDLNRTVGGSSGGPGASIAANFATLAIGQEGFASIRRPSTWNSLVGMRPTAGLVSRAGVWGGWPTLNGSLGPMARTVKDLATLLDVMVGYDPEDPITALGVGKVSGSYTKLLDKNGLKGARIGVLRESIGSGSKPESDDFAKVTKVFDKAIAELKAAGAVVVDPVVIPKLKELLATRAGSPTEGEEAFHVYFSRSANPPFKSREDAVRSPDYAKVYRAAQGRLRESANPEAAARHYQYLMARDELMTNVFKVMADNKLDAIVHKSVEHQPSLLSESLSASGGGNQTGAPHLNTFLVFVPAIAVPTGFTDQKLPVGITFMGRPYTEGTLIKLAYSYEQATHHRKPPDTTPPLPGEP